MARYRVTERQVVTYTWEVSSEDYDDVQSLQNALAAVDGVPEDAASKLVESETTYVGEACTCMTEDPGDGYGERVVTHSGTCPEHPDNW